MKQTTIKLPEDFEKGCCQDCPFAYPDEDYKYHCVFWWRYSECELDIEEIANDKRRSN